MSEIMLNVLDADRTCHGSVHGSVGDRIVAAKRPERYGRSRIPDR